MTALLDTLRALRDEARHETVSPEHSRRQIAERLDRLIAEVQAAVPKDGACFIDSFTTFDHLTQREKKSTIRLLDVLAPRGRFSVFEATETKSIAKAFSKLHEWGWVRDLGGQYPWVEVEVTEKGTEALRAWRSARIGVLKA